MSRRLSRRRFLEVGGLAVAGLAAGVPWPNRTHEIRMWSDAGGAHVGFVPRGLLVAPGDTVRWVVDGANVHTSTAYHPANGNAPLRIPTGARPWDSGYLLHPGDHFEVLLNIPGVYDYFCRPHEAVGMVGRIVVGDAGSPPYFPAPHAGRRPIPEVAIAAFPDAAAIVRRGRVD